MVYLPKPVKVSPLIKLFRWTILVCGIIRGRNQLNRYIEYEKVQKVLRMKAIEERRRLEKILSDQDTKALINLLASEFGFEPPSD